MPAISYEDIVSRMDLLFGLLAFLIGWFAVLLIALLPKKGAPAPGKPLKPLKL